MNATVTTAFVTLVKAAGSPNVLSAKVYPAGDVPQGTAALYAFYETRGEAMAVCHDRKPTGRMVSNVALTIVGDARAALQSAADTVRRALHGANSAGAIRCIRLASASDAHEYLDGREKPLFAIELLFYVSASST